MTLNTPNIAKRNDASPPRCAIGVVCASVLFSCATCGAAPARQVSGQPAPVATQAKLSQPTETHRQSKTLGPAIQPDTRSLGSQTYSIAPAEPSKGVLRTIVSLAVVIAIMVFLAAVLKSVANRSGGLASRLGAGGRAPSGLLEVLGRYPVGRKQQLVLLRLHSRVLLLSQSMPSRSNAGGFTTLAELADADEVARIIKAATDADSRSSHDSFNGALNDAFGADDTANQFASHDLTVEDTHMGITVDQALASARSNHSVHAPESDQAHNLRSILSAMSGVVTSGFKSCSWTGQR